VGLGLTIVKHHAGTRRNPHPHPPGRRRAPRHGATTRRATKRRRCLRSYRSHRHAERDERSGLRFESGRGRRPSHVSS
jgi:hypothetical protein